MNLSKHIFLIVFTISIVTTVSGQTVRTTVTKEDQAKAYQAKSAVILDAKAKIQDARNPNSNNQVNDKFVITEFSNPNVKDIFSLSIDAFVKGELNYSLRSDTGEISVNLMKSLSKGINNIEIDISDQIPGKYTLILKMGNAKETLDLFRIE